jgi:predicted nucleotidyltransferase
MGMKSSTHSSQSLSDALFPGTKQRVLGILYGQPERSFYANELIKLAVSGSGAVQRELATLTRSGLVSMKQVGNQKHYQANANSPIFTELRGIIQKTVGLADPLRQALQAMSDQIIAAFVYGSVAKKTDTASSDIDLMVIADDLSYGALFTALEEAGVILGRPVNPTILSLDEFHNRITKQESFLTRVMEQPKLWILGEERDFSV